MGWACSVHVVCMGDMRKIYTVLAGNPEGMRLLGRRRYR
jgi:hypothetical protein